VVRSHGALCMCTSENMHEKLPKVFYGGGNLTNRNRIQCIVKSTFSETRLVPALNDILISHPSPAAVSRFRMGWLNPALAAPETNSFIDTMEDPVNPSEGKKAVSQDKDKDNIDSSSLPLFPNSFSENGLRNNNFRRHTPSEQYGTVTRFGGIPFDVTKSLNAWSSGMWICTSTGSTAAMHAAGGRDMDLDSTDLQYLIREHMIEARAGQDVVDMNNKMVTDREQLHVRWNSHKGRIYIDGSHLTHDLDLGDEILINNKAPPLRLFLCDQGH